MEASDRTKLAGPALWVGLSAVAVLFVALAWPMRWANDDAFITFRYAKHLAEGHGFVWNIVDGEPVEGSTSLAWTVLNAGAIFLGIDPVLFSHCLGVAGSLLGLWLIYYAARRVFALSPIWSLLAPALLVGHRQWLVWAVGGLETRVASVMQFAATLVMIVSLQKQKPRWLLGGLLFFVATLFRPETPLLHLAAGLGAILAWRSRPVLRAVVLSGAVHVLLLLTLMAWRLSYFGLPLPNTVFVKVGAAQPEDGLRYIGQFIWQTHGWLWLPLLCVGLLFFWRKGAREMRPGSGLQAALLAQIVLWVVWITVAGGGAWEFRFFDTLLPAIALSLTMAVSLMGRARVMLAVALLISQAATYVTGFNEFWPVVNKDRLVVEVEGMLREGRILAKYIGPEDRISIGWAGALPFTTDAWHLDPWGLNDREIAQREFDADAVIYHQRHATWDDVVKRNVMFCDIFNQFIYRKPLLPGRIPRNLMPWARKGIPVFCLYLPKDDRYWIFASARSTDEVKAWAEARGLELRYVTPLPFGPQNSRAKQAD